MPLVKRQSSREFYNPIRGLSLSRLVALEDQAERGQHADLQWFYYHMEKADVTILAAMARRLAFIDALDWEIKQVENADPVLAQEQAGVLRYAYDRIANLKEATRFLAGALFRGFAHLEKIYTGWGRYVSRRELREQWYWIKKLPGGEWAFNPESKSVDQQGLPVDRRDFCVLEASPIHRAIGRHFFSKTLAFADWDTALENSANQSIFIIGPQGATEEKEREYQAVAVKMTSDGRGYLPYGADVKTVDLFARTRLPFFERVEYCDKQIVLAATGGLLTMLTESGSGTLAGGAHSESLLGLARSDAARLSEVFQRDLDKAILQAEFPHQPHAAYFQFDVPTQEDSATFLQSISGLSWMGYRVEQKQLEEKSGLKLELIPTPGGA